jgi:anti-sigma regulatory factor (Ser/Thr protein kinase)
MELRPGTGTLTTPAGDTATGRVDPQEKSRVRLRLQPLPSSSSAGRVAVRQFLIDVGRLDLTPDILVVVSELIANAVMHARTEMTLSVELDRDGVQVAVTDGSHVLPHWSPRSPTSMSGRGLPLVVRLSRDWGVEPLPDGGKRVWATVDATSVIDDSSSPEDLMELWSDQPWPTASVAESGIDVDLDVDVQAMLDSRAHTEDLVRDLQLTLMSVGDAVDAGTAAGDDATLVKFARQLDTANEQFQNARRQMFDQTVSAARGHQTQATLHLRLQSTDADCAQRWLEALDEADRLTAEGTLLLPQFPAEMTAFRRQYIGTIIDRLAVVPEQVEAQALRSRQRAPLQYPAR